MTCCCFLFSQGGNVCSYSIFLCSPRGEWCSYLVFLLLSPGGTILVVLLLFSPGGVVILYCLCSPEGMVILVSISFVLPGGSDGFTQYWFHSLQGERCSYSIQMWHFHLQGLQHDLCTLLAPVSYDLVENILLSVLSQTLSHLARRYSSTTPSHARLNQFRCSGEHT